MKNRGRRNILTGEVVSDKMNKSISVLVYKKVPHPKYKKYVKKSSIFKAHDEENKAKKGDQVRIFETKVISKTKRWKFLDVVSNQAGETKIEDIN